MFKNTEKMFLKKSKVEGPALPDIKIYFQATVISMNKQINGPEQSPGIDSKTSGKLVLAKVAFQSSGEKMVNFISFTDLADMQLQCIACVRPFTV